MSEDETGQSQWRDWTKASGSAGYDVESRLALIEKNFRTHLGIDFAASGIDYPHPSQRVRSIIVANGYTLNATGAQFKFDTYGRGLFWTNNDPVERPETLTNPQAWVMAFGTSVNTKLQMLATAPSGSNLATITMLPDDTSPSTVITLLASASGAGADAVLYISNTGLSGNSISIGGAALRLHNTTSDHPLSNGSLWYRSDTHKFRAVVSSAVENLATESYVTAALPTTMNKQPFAAKTTTYTTTNADGVISVDATSAAFTVALVTAVGNSGLTQTLKKIDSTANVVTIDANTTQTIDGALTIGLSTQWAWLTIVSNGANWLVTGMG